jgi:predicted ABC-type ATPase
VTASIFVLAGVNGAGKSSIGGSVLREAGMNYFNPDEAASKIRNELGCSVDEANGLAWQEGKRLLEAAIRKGTRHAFESTLGGKTIPRLLAQAAQSGLEIRVWFIGLASPEQHIARVRDRVAAGGHDIPEAKIRERWESSRRNLIALLPYVADLRLFDNSEERNRATGKIPPPKLLLHWRAGAVVAPEPAELAMTPEWAKPIVAYALQLQRGGL